MTTGDNLWADKDSRADLQIGSTSHFASTQKPASLSWS